MNIKNFVSVNSQEKKLKKIRESSTKEERREREEKLLVPEEIPPYTKEKALSLDDVSNKKVMLVFSTAEDVELLSKYFKISEYKGKNIRSSNINMFVDFLKALENGEISYDKERREFQYHKRSDEMSKRERRHKIKIKRVNRNE